MSEITSIEELNDHKNRCVYLLFNDFKIIATTTKDKMNKILEDDTNSIVHIGEDDPSDALMIYGLVLDPKELPFEIPEEIMRNNKLWLIISDIPAPEVSIEQYDSLDELISAIEEFIESYFIDDIDSIAIILGHEVGLTLKVRQTGNKLLADKVYNDS